MINVLFVTVKFNNPNELGVPTLLHTLGSLLVAALSRYFAQFSGRMSVTDWINDCIFVDYSRSKFLPVVSNTQ